MLLINNLQLIRQATTLPKKFFIASIIVPSKELALPISSYQYYLCKFGKLLGIIYWSDQLLYV